MPLSFLGSKLNISPLAYIQGRGGRPIIGSLFCEQNLGGFYLGGLIFGGWRGAYYRNSTVVSTRESFQILLYLFFD